MDGTSAVSFTFMRRMMSRAPALLFNFGVSSSALSASSLSFLGTSSVFFSEGFLLFFSSSINSFILVTASSDCGPRSLSSFSLRGSTFFIVGPF